MVSLTRTDEAEELSRLIHVGGDALQGGRLAESRAILDKVLLQSPRNQKAQSLLGLVCFKLGDYARATELYSALVRENPVEPTLRVNLGLVHLKTGALQTAIREFQTAVDLAPEHKKAQNYLGLALSQAGDLLRAREAFAAAGSTAMVEKLEQALSGRPPSASALPAVRPTMPEEPESSESPQPPTDSQEPPALVSRGAMVSDLVLALRLAGAQTTTTPFQVHGGLVGVRVAGEVFTRLEHMVAVIGQVTLAPEVKRFRGRSTDKPFGRGPARFNRASGQGLIWLSTFGRMFMPLDLGDAAFYFVEERIFAFEESLTFENGRLPGRSGTDLNLVHLRGQGKVLVTVPGPLRSVEVTGGSSSVIAVEHLVGWMGSLTPKMVAFGQEGEADSGMGAIELTGDGFALVCLPETE